MTGWGAERLAQRGVRTPGCDCGHEGMGAGWHAKQCRWRRVEDRRARYVEPVKQAGLLDFVSAPERVAQRLAEQLTRIADCERMSATVVLREQLEATRRELAETRQRLARVESGAERLAAWNRSAGRVAQR